MICHIPLTIFVTLYPLVKYTEVATVTDTVTANLTDFHQRVDTVLQSNVLRSKFPDPDEYSRMLGMVNRSMQYLAVVLASGAVNRTELMAFSYANNDDINHSLNTAAAGQVKGLYSVMETWRTQLSADVWNNLKVVVATSHMARRQNLVSQAR